MRTVATALLLVLHYSASALAASPETQGLIDRAASECTSFETGEFDKGDAVTEITLRSQYGNVVAELVDES